MKTEKPQQSHSSEGDDHRREDDPLGKALQRIRRTREFPTISKYIVEINQKLQDTSIHASASELSNIILKDYALTNKLLKWVNSAFYGLVAGKVTTVTRAVVLLGHDNVRMAAVSLVLFEHFKSNKAAKDLKDAIIRSFWCGLLAKEIAMAQRGIDPEEAFICGLLHRLGKLLVIYHMDRDYREIQYRVTHKGEKEAKAVKRILGMSYRALGVAVAKQWNFPETIYRTMATPSNEQLQANNRPIDPIWAVVGFTDSLGEIISSMRPSRQKAAIQELLDRYHRYITFEHRQVRALIGEGLDKLYSHAEALQFDVEESEFLRQFSGESGTDANAVRDASAPQAKTDTEPAFQLMGDEDLKGPAIESAGQDAVGIIMGGIQELSNSMLGQFDLNDIALMSLEVIYRALQCNRAILFINERRSQNMEARFGYGKDIDSIIGHIDFKMPPSDDLFGRAIASGKDLIIEDAHLPELDDLIPEWYRQGIDARAFIFLPVIYMQVCVGAYYADMVSAGSLINSLEHRYLAMLRNQMILAIKMGR